MIALAPAFRSVDSIAGLEFELSQISLGSVWHCMTRFPARSVRCKLFDTPNVLEPCMLSSVRQQAHITLSHLHFLGLVPFVALALIWWSFIPSASRLGVELQHAWTRLAEVLQRSVQLENTIALFFCFFSFLGKRNSLFHPWPFPFCMHLTFFVGWTVMTHFTNSQREKVAIGLLLDKLHKQDLAGPLSSRASRVLGPISHHRVVDIQLHTQSVSRASRLGLLVDLPLHPL